MSQRVIVTPGDRMPEGVEAREPYVVEVDGVKIATTIGLLDTSGEKPVYIPLQSIYIPKKGDVVIGLVQSVGVVNWTLDINSPYTGVLPANDFLGRSYNPATDDLSQYLQVGDYVKVKIAAFDRTRNPLLTVQDKGLGKIVEGKIV
jgi:exosome complex component RRP4